MEKRRLGRTGLTVSVIGVGGGPYRGPDIDTDQVARIADTALEGGINLFETAEDYDEAKMGWALRETRSEVVLATKNTESTYTAMKRGIEKSLAQLRTDFIDVYQMHFVNSRADFKRRIDGGALTALTEARSAGRLGYLGLSGHHVPTLIEAIELGHFDMVQVPYHLGHSEAEKLFPVAERLDVGVLAMKTLGGGFLVDPGLEGERPRPEAEKMKVDRCIRYVTAQTGLASALVGFRDPRQVVEVVAAAESDEPWDEAAAKRIHAEVNDFLGDEYCRTCKYCAPCAVHGWDLDIDGILRMEGFYRRYGYRRSALEAYGALQVKADACIACGTCAGKCPYGLAVPDRLRRAHDLFTEGAFHLAGELARGTRLEDAVAGLDRVEAETDAVREERRRCLHRYHLWKETDEPEAEHGREEGIRLEAITRLQGILPEAKHEMETGAHHRAAELFGEGDALLRAADDGSRVVTHHRIFCLSMMKRCHELLGESDEADARGREAEPLLRTLGRDVDAIRDLGDLFMRHGEYETAIGYLRKAVEVCGSAGSDVGEIEPLWGSLIRWYREQERYDEAIAFIEDELTRYPKEPNLLFHCGECFMEKGDYPRAIRTLEEAVESRPRMNWIHFSLGKCFYLTGDLRRAVEAFDANFEHCDDPLSHFHALYFKAMALHRLGDRQEAQRCLDRTKTYPEFAGRCEIPEEQAFLREWEGGGVD